MAVSWNGVKFCCFCVPLKTGVKFFGFYSICGCLLNLLLSFSELGYTISCSAREKRCGVTVEDLVINVAYHSMDILVQIIQTIASVLLLMAAYQHNRKLALPWLVSTVVSAITEILVKPSFPVRMVEMHHQMLYRSVHWIYILGFQIVDDLYGWLIVFSYCRSPAAPSSSLVTGLV